MTTQTIRITDLPPAKAEKEFFADKRFRVLSHSGLHVTENVMLPAMTGVRNISRAQMRNRAQELLDWVGLADRMNHMPLELSGGEQQRVALARALINEPALILADEPTGNLDRMTGGQIIDMLFGLSLTRALSVVMVTHSLETASLCDRMVEIQDGLLMQRES